MSYFILMLKLPEIPDSEKTPLVIYLIEIIQQQAQENNVLKKEIDRLKNKPKKPKLRPSKISFLEKKSQSNKKKNNTKKPKDIKIHHNQYIIPDNLPKGSKLFRYKDYIVQDIELKPNNTRYRLAVYRLPDGSFKKGKLPKEVTSHFGNELKAHILYLYYKGNMTQPVILEYLRENGISISSAQISRILTEGHDEFHNEQKAILKTGLEVSK